jgi:8-oxo-dGTP diphosphatase
MWWNKPPRAEPVRVLVRHADAGLRSAWHGADEWRGLTNVGHQQARALVGMLADLTVLRILSSPSLRCRQTVVPLALAYALDVEPCWQLTPSVEAEDAMSLISDPETASSVVCTHRETLQALFERLAGPHHPAVMQSDPMEKAAVWILRGAVGGARAPRLEYLGSGAALVRRQAVASPRWPPDPRRERTGRRWPTSARSG